MDTADDLLSSPAYEEDVRKREEVIDWEDRRRRESRTLYNIV